MERNIEYIDTSKLSRKERSDLIEKYTKILDDLDDPLHDLKQLIEKAEQERMDGREV
jgi:hypothetical protein